VTAAAEAVGLMAATVIEKFNDLSAVVDPALNVEHKPHLR